MIKREGVEMGFIDSGYLRIKHFLNIELQRIPYFSRKAVHYKN
jgi:hypothetical protein